MIPIVESWSQRIGIPKTKFLIPLSFASMLGGMCTLIGTSTNLILAALVNRDDPSQSIGMFDMTVVGAPLLVIGVIYMAVASRFLLPDKDSKSVSASTQKMCVRVLLTLPWHGESVVICVLRVGGHVSRAATLSAWSALSLCRASAATKPSLSSPHGHRWLASRCKSQACSPWRVSPWPTSSVGAASWQQARTSS